MSKYSIILSDNIFWKSRKQYFQILKLYVDRKITLNELFKQYSTIKVSNFDSLKILKKNLEAEALTEGSEIDFELNPKSCGFTKMLADLDNHIDLVDPDIDFDMNLKHPELLSYGMSEEFFWLDLKDIFLPIIGEYCEES